MSVVVWGVVALALFGLGHLHRVLRAKGRDVDAASRQLEALLRRRARAAARSTRPEVREALEARAGALPERWPTEQALAEALRSEADGPLARELAEVERRIEAAVANHAQVHADLRALRRRWPHRLMADRWSVRPALPAR